MPIISKDKTHIYRLPTSQAPKKIAIALMTACVLLPVYVYGAQEARPKAAAMPSAGILSSMIDRLLPLYRHIIGQKPAIEQKSPADTQPGLGTTRGKLPHTIRQDIIAPPKPAPMLLSPDLGVLLAAEFAMDRNDPLHALTLYKSQAFKNNATAVFERALSLSMQLETPKESLHFAKAWQDSHSDHVPVWFYVTHLALKAEDYRLAAQNLRLILHYDPQADLSQIFTGILPNHYTAQRQLFTELQTIGGDDNPSLSVLKAGLLVRLHEPVAAVLYLDNALSHDNNNLAYLILKADILKDMGNRTALLEFLTAAANNAQGNTQKQLHLYQARYLIDQGQLLQAWQVLQAIPNKDSDMTFLASLVALDLQRYDDANALLLTLTKTPKRASEAYYYLGISHERMQDFAGALRYFAKVDDMQFVLPASKKQVAYELLFERPQKAIDVLIKLRQRYEMYASDSYLLQADILLKQGKTADAKILLESAYQAYPDDPSILYAKIQLMDDVTDYAEKLQGAKDLLEFNPDNLQYQLLHAKLLLQKNPNDTQSLEQVFAISTSSADSETSLMALLILANNAQRLGNYQTVLDLLQTPYSLQPTLSVGTILLHAYQALGDNDKAQALLDDLSKRFGSPALPAVKPAH